MFESTDAPSTSTLVILLLPGFSLGEVGLLADCVSEVNEVAERICWRLKVCSMDGLPVASAQGRQVPVDGTLELASGAGLILVAAGGPPKVLTMQDDAVTAIAALARQRTVIGGIRAGAFWLAAAGLLNGCRATVHWSMLETFTERHPQVIATSGLFECDRDRATCGGGTSVVDLFLNLVSKDLGAELATTVAERLLLDRLRGRDDKQRIPLRNRPGGTQPKLVQAVTLMEANLEEPLTTDEIAQHVCVSRRQLERLFKQHLDRVPSQYYLELRLNRARQMLRQSSKSIIQIGLSCGFSSGPHFSSAYRNHFGVTPRDDRQRSTLRDEP